MDTILTKEGEQKSEVIGLRQINKNNKTKTSNTGFAMHLVEYECYSFFLASKLS